MSAEDPLIACPHCAAMNRVLRARLAEAPACGRCHHPLFTGVPLALGEADFDRHALRSTLPLLVDFWAPWCGPCKTLGPLLEKLETEYAGRFKLAKIDSDQEQQLAAAFGIRSIPTMVLLQGGREIARQSGAMPAEAIVRWARGQVG